MTLEKRTEELKDYIRTNRDLFRHNHELIKQGKEYKALLEPNFPEYREMNLSEFMLNHYLPSVHWGMNKEREQQYK